MSDFFDKDFDLMNRPSGDHPSPDGLIAHCDQEDKEISVHLKQCAHCREMLQGLKDLKRDPGLFHAEAKPKLKALTARMLYLTSQSREANLFRKSLTVLLGAAAILILFIYGVRIQESGTPYPAFSKIGIHLLDPTRSQDPNVIKPNEPFYIKCLMNREAWVYAYSNHKLTLLNEAPIRSGPNEWIRIPQDDSGFISTASPGEIERFLFLSFEKPLDPFTLSYINDSLSSNRPLDAILNKTIRFLGAFELSVRVSD